MHNSGGSATLRRGAVAVAATIIATAGISFIGATNAEALSVPVPVPENAVTAHGPAPTSAPAGLSIHEPLVGMAATATGFGSWAVASDGGVFTTGDAPFYGSLGGQKLGAPVVAIAATPTHHGYWLAAADGGVFSFGDAGFYGNALGLSRNAPTISIASTPSGHGYWLTAADGGVFTFGDATFFGSPGGAPLNAPIVAMGATPNGHGYWLVASDGGVFTYGNAPFLGSTASTRINAPITGFARSHSGSGYWLVGGDGGVFSFGDAAYLGSDLPVAGDPASTAPTPGVVGITADPVGSGYWLVHGTLFAPAAAGAIGPQVARIQSRLRDLGYWIGPITSQYGFLTVQAVYAFQKVNRLPVTGNVDPVTAAWLSTADRPAPSRGGDLIEIDKVRQVLFVVRGGQVVWAFNTSTGSERNYGTRRAIKIAHTPEGNFSLLRQVNGFDRSPLGLLYRPKYFTNAGHAIHGYTSVPPFPASHGCVRVSNAAMDFLWGSGLTPLGLSVWVHA
jgi:peptidoglycan hydrolase-like protein with peptidoglycan-binding domain